MILRKHICFWFQGIQNFIHLFVRQNCWSVCIFVLHTFFFFGMTWNHIAWQMHYHINNSNAYKQRIINPAVQHARTVSRF